MSRSIRLFDLIQTLRRRRRAVSAAVLAEELGVSKRTLYRDIGTLITLGAPIDGERGVGYLLKPGFLLPPLMFNEEELEALRLGAMWVTQRADHGLVTAAENALAKIVSVLPIPLASSLDDPRLMSAPIETTTDKVDPAMLRTAIRRERKLRIVYAAEAGVGSERVIWPIALVYFDAVRLLVAWCEMREGFRHFRTDRIASAVALDDRYPKTRQALIKAWRAYEAASGRHVARKAAAKN
jgi:predicted DNA-binding transcriptional regulator YafY